jgi:hypothetical protein
MESVCKLFRNDVPQPGIYDNPHLDGSASAFNTDNGGNNCSYPTGTNAIDPGGLPPVNVEPPPTVAISANPNPVTQGASSTLTWSSSVDADSCTGAGFNTGGQTSGSAPVGPINSATTYSVTCTGPGGSNTKSVTVNVISPPSCGADFNINPSGGDGSNISISWSGSGCAYYYFDESGGNAVLGNCTSSDRCWVGGGGSTTISTSTSFCWTFNAGTDPWGTLVSSAQKCYSYSPPGSGGGGGGGGGGGTTYTCWDGSTVSDPSQCPPQPICRTICFFFLNRPPKNNFAINTFSVFSRLLTW